MPRYFFHFIDGPDVLRDVEGTELPAAALPAAVIRSARSCISHDAIEGAIRLSQRIDVEDGAHHLVHRLWFRDAVAVTDR